MKYKKTNIIYVFLKNSSKFLDKLLKNKRKLLIALLLLPMFFLIITKYKPLFMIVFLILLGALSMIYIRFFKYAHYLGVELCTMSTILASLAYGPGIGAIVGFVSISSGLILSGYFKPTYFVSVLTLPLIGLIVPFFSDLSMLQLGLLMTVIYDFTILPLYVLMGSRITSTIVFFITHIMFNYWVFTTIAPVLINLLI